MSRSSAAALDHAPSKDSSSNDDASTAQSTWAEDKSPTRPLPLFRLEEEARRLDQAAAQACAQASRFDEDATVTVSAEENKKLLASVFAAASRVRQDAIETLPGPIDDAGDDPGNQDEPTLDAPAPAPSSPEAIAALTAPRPVRVTARPPALKMLVITRPAPTHTPRPSIAPAAVISPAAVPEALAFPRNAPAYVMSLSASAPASTPLVLVPPPSGLRRKITPEFARSARDGREAEDRRRSAATCTVRLPRWNVQSYVVAGIWAMALSLLAVLMFMATSA